jgi:hypothetical protein
MADDSHDVSPTEDQSPHIATYLADAVYYHIGRTVRDYAMNYNLNHDELMWDVWRLITMDAFHALKRPSDITCEVTHMFAEWKRANG